MTVWSSGKTDKCVDGPVKIVACLMFTLLLGAFASQIHAGDPSTYRAETYLQWLQQYANAKPDFKPGDHLTATDFERMKPFVPPGYLEQLNFPEFHADIVAPTPQPQVREWFNCTEKYGSQVKMAPNGGLLNYRCGQPFLNDLINVNDPLAGYKAAWDYYWRWVNHGWIDLTFDVVWMRAGNNHQLAGFVPGSSPPTGFIPGLSWSTPFPTAEEVARDHGGGGFIQRYASAFYGRISFSHLADLEGASIPGEEGIDFKNLTWFQNPFDIRGTAFNIYRYSDQLRADDAWAYIPNLRRVRRITAEVKSDSLLGTDVAIDDFDGFNDRVLNWDWKFLGWKDVLAVHDPTHYVKYYGPNGSVSDDVRSIKQAAVTIRTPRNTRHPYSAVINFWQHDTWAPIYQFIFDRRNRLWKVIEWQYKYSETFTPGYWSETMRGAYAPIWWTLNATDVQNHTVSLFRNEGPVMVKYTPQMLRALFDINSLEQVHR